ncbi:MAG: DUF368 domain-containing protein [Pseudomonadota bacterium]
MSLDRARVPGLLLRGAAMGVAEVVPGVSGGTIAFVTGIYDEFIDTLAQLDHRLVATFIELGPVATWRRFNLGFLCCLGLGMVTAALAFARLIESAFVLAAPMVWAFFFGLILYSAGAMAVTLSRRRYPLVLLGALLGVSVTTLAPAGAPDGALWFFAGGALAISAWLLPAVSGSFLLLLLGLYEPVVRAVNDLDIVRVGLFMAGCAFGVLAFTKLLRWVLVRYRDPLIAVLTGLMFGALPKLWPWQFDGALLSPSAYAAIAEHGSLTLWVPPSAVLGALLLWALSRVRA